MANFREEIKKALKKHIKSPITLEIPPDPKLGDYAFPCFSLAKELKKSPAQIAKEISEKLEKPKCIREIKAEGPYINFFLDKTQFSKTVIHEIITKKNTYGSGKEKSKTAIEFPAPNTNKPLHLGHARNMLLGESISRILEFSGNKVYRVNLNNDRGIHICKSMVAYSKYGNNETPESAGLKPDHFIGKYYVLFSEKAEKIPKLEEEAAEMLRKWESGDKKTIKLWKKMNTWALEGFSQTYREFGIKHDKVYNESEYYSKGKDIVLDCLKKGHFTKDEKGNIVAPLEKHGLPDKILLRADTTSVYITQDIALAKIKQNDFNMDKSIYVVGSEQNLHFRQLFRILEIIGFSQAGSCFHLSYGMISLPEGKMKSRQGTVVDADDIALKMKALAEQEIKKRHNLGKEELKSRSEKIGMAALKFFILKYEPTKDFVFNPKESISFEGETGPYVQYTHARICSIIRKSGIKDIESLAEKSDFSFLSSGQESAIISLLSRYPSKLKEAASSYKPSAVARYLLDLSQAFNEFYHSKQILKEKQETRNPRLILALCVKNILSSGLKLLGIDAPDKM